MGSGQIGQMRQGGRGERGIEGTEAQCGRKGTGRQEGKGDREVEGRKLKFTTIGEIYSVETFLLLQKFIFTEIWLFWATFHNILSKIFVSFGKISLFQGRYDDVFHEILFAVDFEFRKKLYL